MHGMFGFPGGNWGRWGRKRRWGGPLMGGGWVFPAMIIGRLVQEVLEQNSRGQAGWPQADNAPAPPAPTPPTQNITTAWSEPVAAAPAPTPARPAPARRECRYCGRDLAADARQCVGCGAPGNA